MSAPKLDNVSTKQQRIAMLARQGPQMAFTSLAHYIDIEWLREAYGRTRKDGAAGVDGQTLPSLPLSVVNALEPLRASEGVSLNGESAELAAETPAGGVLSGFEVLNLRIVAGGGLD